MNNINIQREINTTLLKYLTNVKHIQSVHSKAVPCKLFKFMYEFRFTFHNQYTSNSNPNWSWQSLTVLLYYKTWNRSKYV